MPYEDAPDAEARKILAFAVAELSSAAALGGDPICRAYSRAAEEDYLAVEIPGNANPFVPWSDPQIPYECTCGDIIYSDTKHSH